MQSELHMQSHFYDTCLEDPHHFALSSTPFQMDLNASVNSVGLLLFLLPPYDS
jgi:hypothetical protein